MACPDTLFRSDPQMPAQSELSAAFFALPSPLVAETETDLDLPLKSTHVRPTVWQDWEWSGSLLDPAPLFAEFQPLVRRLIRRYGGDDRELCQDLSGEIYRRFWDLLNAYDPQRGVPLRPYLVRQLTASVYTYARQQWRSRRREVSLEEMGMVPERGHAMDPTSGWVESLMQQQVCAALPGLIGRLPRRQRQVVIWRYYEQRSFEEIAGLLDIREATARSLLRHGLTKLRGWLLRTDRD